ncbi:hypothetical protein VTL71DRAFT_16438 [Oculimacula yallundae]|uniref:Heterokaryon incompatibility domain-containing protein n=1 Tax=Oculimacula yallundae TaxID=86028 RepID=A0ABR4CEG0_9HELO
MSRPLSFDRLFKHSRWSRASKKSPLDENILIEHATYPIREETRDEASPVLTTFDSSSREDASPISSQQDLCARCLSIDIPAIFTKKVINRSTTGDLITKLRMSAPELLSATCPLCKLFGVVCLPINPENRHELRAISADRAFTKLDLKSVDAIVLNICMDPSWDLSSDSSLDSLWDLNHFLGLVDTSENDPSDCNFGIRILNRAQFDIANTKHWLHFCQNHHSQDCVPTKLKGIVSFRVMDCLTQTVMDAPKKCQYVALSYVWGPSQNTEDGESGIPSLGSSPKVITDSMKVTTLLGFRYLWVDRYCIDQSNADERHDQINRMDMIYASAQITIIAAAGDSPDVGLPGVNGTLRDPQPSYQVGNYRLVSSLITASDSLHQTAWSSRAWTYQEGLLSKRRLIFAADQVHFECNGMSCAEIVRLPLDAMHNPKTGKAKPEIPAGAFVEKAIRYDGESTKDQGGALKIMDYVSRYTQRQLSYQSDALNAIQGIFRVFEKLQYPTYQLMGIPMEPLSDPSGFAPRSKLGSTLRSPEDEFMTGLMWHHKFFQPGRSYRRSGFPSWTWAGWEGRAEDALELFALSEPQSLGAKISVELSGGTLLSFPQKHSLLPRFLSQVRDTRFIHITAKVATCEIIHSDQRSLFRGSASHRSPYLALILGASQAISLNFLPGDILNGKDFSQCSLQEMKFTAIIFAPVTDAVGNDWRVSVLVVEEKDDFAERVGICLQPLYPDLSLVETEHHLIPNAVENLARTTGFHGPRHFTVEERRANKQAFKKWIAELPTRTIRLG